MKKIKELYERQVDGSGIALFRIVYSAVLFCEVAQLFYFRHLVFDRIPFIEPPEIDVTYGLIAWMVVIVFLMLGLFTRQSAILNYAFSLVYIGTISNYAYHMFYLYMGVNFLLIFTNSSQVNSLDRLREKMKYSVARSSRVPRTVSVLNYYIILLVAVAFVYIDSVFWKLLSQNWMTGIGMWLPASMAFMTYSSWPVLLNAKWLMLSLGYLTFAFEAFFAFLFFRKSWRIPLVLIGIGLHLGIAIIFPIPWFGLGVVAIYLLLVPLFFWRTIHNVLSFKTPRLTIFYNEEHEPCKNSIIFLKHFDVFKAISLKDIKDPDLKDLNLPSLSPSVHMIYSLTFKGELRRGIDTYTYAFRYIPIFFLLGWLIRLPGVYHLIKWIYQRERTYCPPQEPGYINAPLFRKVNSNIYRVRLISIAIGLLFFLQFSSSYNTPLITWAASKIGFYDTYGDQKIRAITSEINIYTRILLGITNHPVFIDSHFSGYNHIVALEAIENNGTREWLPIVDKYGQPGVYNHGFNFVKWTYRVNSTSINQRNMINGIRDFGTFWALKNGKNLNEIKFKIYLKKIDVPLEWEENVLEKQKSAPWLQCGEAYWSNGDFVSTICDIESFNPS